MKILLKKDVANVGRKGDIKEVSNGYAQNFLIGRGLAEIATPAKEKQAQQLSAQRAQQQRSSKEALEGALKKLKGNALVIHAIANEKDHLFEAVHANVIVEHIKDVLGVAVNEDAILIDTPMKELGEYTVHVAVGDEKLPVQIRVEGK